MSKRPVMVGLSGGVDSSVAALLLQNEGRRVEGLFMKNWEDDDRDGHCTAAEDYADARAVCEVLEIPLHAVNFARAYWDRVFQHFLDEYAAGRTPNPDVLCNKEIKFRAFLDHALGLGAERIATGHYVRSDEVEGRHRLLKGRDPEKDQSYFLYTLNQHQLAHSLFPVGELHKSEVRARAAAARLPTHAKRDSTGICFIGERHFRTFLARYLPAQPGLMETPEGEVVGEHAGLMYYTLGQRQGLNIGGRRGGSGAPWFVAGKDLERNVLMVVQGKNHPLLYRDALVATDLHWVSGGPPPAGQRLTAKTRYRQPDQSCTVTTSEPERLTLRFDAPQWAITPGQSVVLYAGDECLGGGIIAASAPADAEVATC
ncbi:tRNA 2-thiouridine(34) synthase MnmA [Ectothiorhodospiraceae bacterium 2226]|nr:tRNA 2-thiouridine(34) synthase MnmA [Ectothiorhodospiraceae bacterium 2226]